MRVPLRLTLHPEQVAYGSAETNLGGSSASSYDNGPLPLQLSLPAASSVNPNRHPVCASTPCTGPLSCYFGRPCTSTRYHRHTMCLPAHPSSLLGDRCASLNGEPAHSHACAAQVWQGQLRQPCSIHLSSSAKLVDDVIILIPPVTSLELLVRRVWARDGGQKQGWVLDRMPANTLFHANGVRLRESLAHCARVLGARVCIDAPAPMDTLVSCLMSCASLAHGM